MKKKLIALIVATLVIATGYIVLANQKADAPSQVTPNSPTTQTTNSETTETAKGQYVAYSTDVIAKTKGTKLLFFHAPWCPQCRSIEAGITEKTIPDNVTIIKVDYDSNQTLRQEYGVTLQTTFVKVDHDGKLIKKYVAYDEPTFDAVKENLL